MAYYTPLRYPGGKRRLVATVGRLLEENQLRDVQYVEPYAGGAAIALALLLEEYATVVHINDLSRPVYAFWYAVLNQNADICRRVELANVNMREWHRQRAIYDAAETAALDDLGFAALFLNRTNRSGIIGGGVIGGKQQTGKWLIDARFEKDELVQRIRKIGRYASRIKVYQSDALDFASRVVPALGENVFAFFDPPYIENGKGLYLNPYTVKGHKDLAAAICALRVPYVVTYDHAAVKHGLYRSLRRIVYGLNYSANGRHQGREVMFFSPQLRLPSAWRAGSTIQLGAKGTRHPVYGKIEAVKPHPEMIEGPPAADRFMAALKTVLSAPKESAPNPFNKNPPNKKKRAHPKKR